MKKTYKNPCYECIVRPKCDVFTCNKSKRWFNRLINFHKIDDKMVEMSIFESYIQFLSNKNTPHDFCVSYIIDHIRGDEIIFNFQDGIVRSFKKDIDF